MGLTEKGQVAVNVIKEFFPNQKFNAQQLSAAANETIRANTLSAIANKGYLIKFNTSPVTYQASDTFNELFTSTESNANNENLHRAYKVKNDEFYTLLNDIEIECKNYITFFRDKIIYLNCDDEESNFWKYFYNHFQEYGLKELWATHLQEPTSYLLKTIDGIQIDKINLISNGDYNNPECIALLDKSDIIITNPPFSKSKEFIALIVEHQKQFLVIGNENAFSSTLIFPLLKTRKVWAGINQVKKFLTPTGEIAEFGNICWFTNLPIQKNIPFLNLTKLYDSNYYDTYNNFDAINVDKLEDIPKDYMGIMGVPVSIARRYNPEQFEILGLAAGNTKNNHLNFSVQYTPHPLDRGGCGIIKNTIRKYTRIFIRRKIKS